MKSLVMFLVGAIFGCALAAAFLPSGKTREIDAPKAAPAVSLPGTAARAAARARDGAQLHWELLPSEHPEAFKAQLRAAGIPQQVMGDIMRGVLERDLNRKLAALKVIGIETNWMPYGEFVQRQKQAEALVAEKSKSEDAAGIVPKKLQFLSSEKYLASVSIEEQARQARDAILVSEGDEAAKASKLREARLEKVGKLRALMDEREYVTYAMKMDPIIGGYASSLQNFEPTEAEFMKLVATYEKRLEAFQMPQDTPTIEAMRNRSAAQASWRDEMRGLLGEERFATYQEQTDPTVRRAMRLAVDAGLSTEQSKWLVKSDRAYNLAALNVPSTEPERRAAIIMQFEQTVEKQLGPAAYAQYKEVMGSWLRAQKHRTMMEARAQDKQLPPGFSLR